MLLPPSTIRPPVLESIYNVGGGKQQSSLSRYLASAGGTAAPRQLGAGQRPRPGSAFLPYEVGQDGSPVSPSTPTVTPPVVGPAPAGTSPAAAVPGPPGISTDYTSDPILQEMLSGNIKDEADANAAALSANRTTLGRYGDKNLAMAILGASDPTIGSISDDPATSTSTLARLHRGYNDAVKKTDDADSVGNIFYGGAHVTNRSNLAKDEQTNEADANASVHDALSQIAAGLQTTKSNIASTRANAERDAADRAAQAAMLQALLGGGGSTDPTAPPANYPTAPPAADPTAPPAADPTAPPAADPGAAIPVPETGVPQSMIDAAAPAGSTAATGYIDPAQADAAAAYGVAPQADMTANDLYAALAASGQPAPAAPTTISPVPPPTMISSPPPPTMISSSPAATAPSPISPVPMADTISAPPPAMISSSMVQAPIDLGGGFSYDPVGRKIIGQAGVA